MSANQQVTSSRGDVFDTLAAIDRGSFGHDIQDAMRNVVQECVGTQKKGSVTITIDIDPDSKTDTLRVSGKVKVSLPQKPKKASIFFPQPDGTLMRMNPRQYMIPGTEHETSHSAPSSQPVTDVSEREVVDTRRQYDRETGEIIE